MSTCGNGPCCSNEKPSLDGPGRFFAQHKIDFPFFEGESSGWRLRSKLAVRGTAQKPLIGLFYPGTHQVYSLNHCKAHHPLINQALGIIERWMIANNIQPYNETAHSGLVRYLQLVVERSSNTIQASFVLTADNAAFKEALKQLFKSESIWNALWTNIQPHKTNTIFSDDWHLIAGKEWLIETIAGHAIYTHPGSFGQANGVLFEKMVLDLADRLTGGNTLVEYYAGVGAIGIACENKFAKIVLNEINPLSKVCFEETKKHLPQSIQNKLHYDTGSAQSALKYMLEADTVIVDPPRKGLDPKTLAALATGPKTLAYISCGFPAFMRDAEVLLKQGWHMDYAAGYHFFPGSEHIETLCIFKR